MRKTQLCKAEFSSFPDHLNEKKNKPGQTLLVNFIMVIVYIATIVCVAKLKKCTLIFCNGGVHHQHDNASGLLAYQTSLTKELLHCLHCDFDSCHSHGTTSLNWKETFHDLT